MNQTPIPQPQPEPKPANPAPCFSDDVKLGEHLWAAPWASQATAQADNISRVARLALGGAEPTPYQRGAIDAIADVEVVDQHQDGGSGVGSTDADVVESSVVAEGEFAVAVDDVAADSGLRLGKGTDGSAHRVHPASYLSVAVAGLESAT